MLTTLSLLLCVRVGWGSIDRYEVARSDKPGVHRVLVLERYASKDVFLSVHRESAPFLAFRPVLKAMQDSGRATVSGDSYVETGLGFV